MQVSIQEYVHTGGYTNTHVLNEIISLGMTGPFPRNPSINKNNSTRHKKSPFALFMMVHVILQAI